MARVILDVPSEKMHSFINAVLSLGIDRHAISSARMRRHRSPGRRRREEILLKNISSSFLLFDWEFFSNELEYE
jgi:hypothetical protein